MSEKLFEMTDASGEITTAVFRQQATTSSSHFYNLEATVDSDMVVIGGGATATDRPNGALLTASYPNQNRTGWLASSKDHGVPNSHRLTCFAIGLKLGDNPPEATDDLIQYQKETGGPAAHPTASASLPPDFLLVGGGFRVNWSPGAGNLATASFPEFGSRWTARAKDHGISSPCTIDVWAIGIRGFGVLDFRGQAQFAESKMAAHPFVRFAFDQPGYVLTGIGAESRFNGPGSLLWMLEPTRNGTAQGVTAGSKDHQFPSPGTVKAWALGIRLFPEP